MHNQDRHTILGAEYLLLNMPDDINKKFYIIDGTYGKGLHSKIILDKYPGAIIIAFDYDQANIKSEEKYKDRLIFVHDNFINIHKYITENKIRADFIMIDLGTHMDQVLNPKYGLSFMYEANDIDMRVDNTLDLISAKHVLNQYSFQQLSNIFKFYGNIPNYSQIAHNIINYRKQYEIEKVSDIYAASGIACGHNKQQISKLFQAIRIEVNQEIKNLALVLINMHRCFIDKQQEIKLITFSFHSLEDKIIKNFIQHKPIHCGLEEMFNTMNIIHFKYLNIPQNVICSKSCKKIYKGDNNRRKDLFFIIRNTLMSYIE